MQIIGKPLSESGDVYTPDPRAGAPATGRRQHPPSGDGDKVVLSPRAREINDARLKAAAEPDVRQDMVHRIRQRITAGTYSVSGEKIAVNLITESVINQMA